MQAEKKEFQEKNCENRTVQNYDSAERSKEH